MWFKIQNQQVTLQIFAKPNAKRTAFLKIQDDRLCIALHAKPHEGEANKELISYLAKLLRLPKTAIILQHGEHSRHKVIQIPLVSHVQAFLDNPVVLTTKK